MRCKYFLLWVLSFWCSIIFAQQKTTTVPCSIPFTLTSYNNIAIQAILNKTDTVQLMFHTAANDVTLTEDAVKKLKTIVFTNSADSVKSWGGSANTSRLSENNVLQIGSLQWDSISIWENKNSGQFTDGKFGTTLLKNKVIEIDFDKYVINVYNSLPAKIKNYQQLNLVYDDGNMFIEASCIAGDSIFKNKFLVHSGYAGDILLDDKFASENKLGEKLKITGEKQLKDSYGNIVKTKKAILPFLKIGKQLLTDVPAGFFEGTVGRQTMSVIGGDVLKRFNIIIDAKRTHIYLKPSHFFNTAYSNT